MNNLLVNDIVRVYKFHFCFDIASRNQQNVILFVCIPLCWRKDYLFAKENILKDAIFQTNKNYREILNKAERRKRPKMKKPCVAIVAAAAQLSPSITIAVYFGISPPGDAREWCSAQFLENGPLIEVVPSIVYISNAAFS